MSRNLGKVKEEAAKVFEKSKDIPVIGDIARLIEVSPIGDLVRNTLTGIESAGQATASLFKGDIVGALEKGTDAAMNLL